MKRRPVHTPRRFRLRTVSLVFAVIAGVWAVTANGAAKTRGKSSHKFDRVVAELSADPGAGDIRVIVTAAKGRKGDVGRALARKQRHVIAEHTSIDAFSVAVPADALEDLASDPAVAHVSIDAPIRTFAVDEVGTLSSNMLLPTLALPYSGYTGNGVGVAVLDSGIVNHAEVPLAAFYDLITSDKPAKAFDKFGHGTHVAGMIKDDQGWSDARYRSIAPNARLIGLRVLGDDGSGYTSTVIRGIDFAIANKASLGIDVLNLSLGHPIYEPAATDPLVQAVERAVAAGIVVVVSAGNEGTNRTTGQVGYAGITSPGNAPSAITVGAVDTRNTVTRLDDQIPSFSSRGPTWYDAYAKPDIVAPGRRVVSFMAKKSVLYNQYPSYRVDVATRTYMTLSGTSMSAAVTSGVVALMIEASRSTNSSRLALPPNALKAILQHTAVPVAGVDELTQGAGSLNAAGAVELARSIDPTRPQGTWWLKSGVSPFTQLPNGERLPWGLRILWGERALSGDALYVKQPAWGSAVIWGNGLIWGDAVIWGNAVVWGNAVIWGNAVVWGNTVLGYSTDGTPIYGDAIDWSSVNSDAVIWGNLSDVVKMAPATSQQQFTPVF